MTRHELIAELASRTDTSKRGAERTLNTLIEIITDSVALGEKVSITNFGTFDLGKRAARHGVNPQTGADIQIPEIPMPRFRAGHRFKQLLRNK